MSRLLAKFFPAIVVAVCGGYLLVALMMPRDRPGDYRLYEFDQLPIVYNGRVMPIDTLARTSLIIVSGKQSFTEEVREEGTVKKVSSPAVKWLLESMLTRPPESEEERMIRGPAAKHKVFRIENEEVLSLLNLEARP